MTLDLVKTYNQVEAMAGEMRAGQSDYRQKLQAALSTLQSCSGNRDTVKRKLESARTTWLVAGLKEDPALHLPAPPVPADFIVVASDGSHIDVDRHQSARLFLLNIGLVMLQYGDEPGADFHTIPQLYYGEERMSLRSEDGKQAIIEGPLLGILRGVEECRCLADYCEKTNPLLPLVALVDGSLILWGLVGQRYDDFVIDRLLVNGFIRQLDRFAAAGADRKLAVASYVSFPRSTDVINLLRVQACPYEPVDCDKNCRGKFADRPCDIVGGLTDRAVFSEVLLPGERSAVFISGSSINDKYGAHQVCFFYLKADEEVSRVELPLWAVDNGGLLTLVHSAVSDQCNKGFGYPVALSEAHEQAVVTGADREQFWNMVERTLADGEVQLRGSLKQRSKKLRWI